MKETGTGKGSGKDKQGQVCWEAGFKTGSEDMMVGQHN